MIISSKILTAKNINHGFLFPEENPPASFFKTWQVHGNDLFVVEKNTETKIVEDTKADGIFSTTGETIAVQTADCIPALFISSDGKTTAAIHAGWRGVENGILQLAVEKFKTEWNIAASALTVVLGPSIGSCCFEVDATTESLFTRWQSAIQYDNQPTNTLSRPENRARPSGNKIWIDLKKIARAQLLESGVLSHQLEILKHCTYCFRGPKDEKFASYRRATHEKMGEKKRQWSFIAKANS